VDSLHPEKRVDIALGKYAPQLRAKALHVPRSERHHERRHEKRAGEREQQVRRERPVPKLAEGRPGIVGDETSTDGT
jgi:hypothetical protein